MPDYDVAFLIDITEKSQVTVYTNIAAWCWLVWDWASMFDDEINFIWLANWSLSKLLYLSTRYFGLFLLTVEAISETGSWNDKFCNFYFSVVGVGTTLILYLVEIGMQFRVYALYDGSKWILYLNGGIFLVEVIILTTLLAVERTYHLKIIHPPLPGCWNSERPRLILVTWFIALAYELYLFSLVAYKAYVRWRDEGRLMGMFRIMFRDAVLWFILITGLLAWNAFMFIISERGYIFLGLPFLHAGACICGSRLVVSIRKAHYYAAHQSTVYVAHREGTVAAALRVQPPEISKYLPKPPSRARSRPKNIVVRNLDSEWYRADSEDSEDGIAMDEIGSSLRTMRPASPPPSHYFAQRVVTAMSSFTRELKELEAGAAIDSPEWDDKGRS
ncbi:hypothetical protein FRB99_004692 [Tulasnella sp. 403]|nr:hypothetical protein FRB99_004692 [Tulasnella sp. 403]